MPILQNPRWEIFASNLAKGQTQGKAYVGAGFKKSSKAAHVLATKPEIIERVREFQELAVVDTTLDVKRIVTELEKLGFSNMLDFVRIDDDGQPQLDFSRLTREQAAAIAEITTDETTNPRTGEVTRRTRFKLLDKKAALDTLGKYLGMFIDRKDIRLGGVMFHINQADADL